MTIPLCRRHCLVGPALIITLLLAWDVPRSFASEVAVVHMGQKLLRGTVNMTTGWGEIPKQIYLKSKTEHPLIGPLLGLFDGIGITIVRISASVYEVSTFLLPVPDHYEPLLKPAFVWETEDRAGD